MESLIKRLQVEDLKLHKSLCLFNEIIELIVEVEHEGIYFNINIIDNRFTKKQCKIIEREIMGKWVFEIFGEYL